MKRLILLSTLALASTSVLAVGTSLKTDIEQYSYAIGINFTQSLMRQGVKIDPDAVYMAIQDALAGKEPQLSASVMDHALRTQAQKAGERKRAMAKENLQKGAAYRETNGKKASVVTLDDGLQYEVLRKGDGAMPKPSDTVKVNYTGQLIDGRVFDSSKRHGKPATFRVDSVIKGWQEVLPLMRVGARWRVTIPPDLAYGVNGAGAAIGPNETLVFEIELLGIEK